MYIYFTILCDPAVTQPALHAVSTCPSSGACLPYHAPSFTPCVQVCHLYPGSSPSCPTGLQLHQEEVRSIEIPREEARFRQTHREEVRLASAAEMDYTRETSVYINMQVTALQTLSGCIPSRKPTRSGCVWRNRASSRCVFWK